MKCGAGITVGHENLRSGDGPSTSHTSTGGSLHINPTRRYQRPGRVHLGAVHGIALAVRAGASGRVYCWAVGAVATIGIGAFAVSFMALRDLMQAIGYGPTTACIFPAIIDTAVAVSTLMLVALGDKPARRTRITKASISADSPTLPGLPQPRAQSAKTDVSGHTQSSRGVPTSASIQPRPAHTGQDSLQPAATRADANLALDLIASGVTTQPVETVVAVLSAHRSGASINAAAKASGINYRTAQRIVEAAAAHQHGRLVAVG